MCKHFMTAPVCEKRKHSTVKNGHRKTLRAIFSRPTLPTIVFAHIEALFMALGGTVMERERSRIKISLGTENWLCHRPHSGKDAKRYPVEEARELLERLGFEP